MPNNDLKFTARTPGQAGNDIAINYEAPQEASEVIGTPSIEEGEGTTYVIVPLAGLDNRNADALFDFGVDAKFRLTNNYNQGFSGNAYLITVQRIDDTVQVSLVDPSSAEIVSSTTEDGTVTVADFVDFVNDTISDYLSAEVVDGDGSAEITGTQEKLTTGGHFDDISIKATAETDWDGSFTPLAFRIDTDYGVGPDGAGFSIQLITTSEEDFDPTVEEIADRQLLLTVSEQWNPRAIVFWFLEHGVDWFRVTNATDDATGWTDPIGEQGFTMVSTGGFASTALDVKAAIEATPETDAVVSVTVARGDGTGYIGHELGEGNYLQGGLDDGDISTTRAQLYRGLNALDLIAVDTDIEGAAGTNTVNEADVTLEDGTSDTLVTGSVWND